MRMARPKWRTLVSFPHLETGVVTEIRYHCVYPCHGPVQEGLAAAVKDNGAEAPSQFGRV